METKDNEKLLELLEKDSTLPTDELASLLGLTPEKTKAMRNFTLFQKGFFYRKKIKNSPTI